MPNAIKFDHFNDIPPGVWRWPNFRPSEIASNGDNSIIIDFYAMDCLQRARNLANRPMHIHCGYRDELHNAKVGGARRSMHLEGKAFDIGLDGFTKKELIAILKQAGFTGLGVNYNSFVHADTGRKRTW